MKLYMPSLYLECEKVDRDLWILLTPFAFMLDDKLHSIPLFFVCDKYTVLGVFLKRDRPNEVENIPAWIHDYLVRFRNILGLSLMDCHYVFLQAMRMCGIRPVMRWVKYLGVVSFNWMIASAGDGTPPPEVRDFIDKHGYGC